MKKTNYISHLLFWFGIYFLWIAIFRSYSIPLTKTITIEFCYLIFITVDFYAISNFIAPQFLIKKRYALFISGVIGVIMLSAWLRALVAMQMSRYFFFDNPIPDFNTLFFNSVMNISLWVFIVTIAKMLMDRIQTQKQLELLEKERVKNELDYLKAQINPHALFNSLNTVYGYIDKSNQAARNVLLQFSELLRYQLYECEAEKVDLGKEMAYLKTYIAFQRLRKNEKLMVDLNINCDKENLKIAPLLLVVLIENAFKFVSNFQNRENQIIISITITGTTLHSSIINTKEFQKTSPANSNGIGIANLNRRLELLYPKKHELITLIEHDCYKTKLIIDLA